MNPRPNILLVDDEHDITANLSAFLERSGFDTQTAADGLEALAAIASSAPELVVLDVLMPRLDGRETLRRLRQAGDWTPVILLTQVGEAFERAMALEEGADDYLNKPFDPHELVARIRAVLRRARPGQPPLSSAWILSSGSLRLDRRARRAVFQDKELDLTPKALLLLEYLMTHPDELLSRERLLDVVWGWEYPVGTRAVDTRIAELRRLLGDDASDPAFIETIPGQGYRFSGRVEGRVVSRRQWKLLGLAVGLPLLLGLAARLLLAAGVLPNPTLKLTADVGTLAFLCGAGLALMLGGLIWLIVWQDRSYRHSLLQVQADASADRRRFLQRLDHEMKNPLTAIQAGLANLNEAPDPQALESVKAQSQRLSRLVSDLRKLADLETRPLEHAPVDLGEILQSVIDLAQEDPRSKGREIDLTLPQAPWPLPPVIGDDDLLLLAMHNLVDNALKFSQPGDRIETRAFEDGSAVVVEVADTGPGIPPDELPHVWEELYRGKGARGVQGSGLGMALVKAIIERHGGSVALRSRVNTGTVVTARLPLGADKYPA